MKRVLDFQKVPGTGSVFRILAEVRDWSGCETKGLLNGCGL